MYRCSGSSNVKEVCCCCGGKHWECNIGEHAKPFECALGPDGPGLEGRSALRVSRAVAGATPGRTKRARWHSMAHTTTKTPSLNLCLCQQHRTWQHISIMAGCVPASVARFAA